MLVKVVDYINSVYNGEIIYSVTTNGLLLTKRKIDYLMNNNFQIAISLNGPKVEHDRMRIDENKKGSFEVIDKAIKYIDEQYPALR